MTSTARISSVHSDQLWFQSENRPRIESGCPALYAGGAATNLKYGEHIVLQEKDTPLANYWLTLVQQAGVPLDRFSQHRFAAFSELLGRTRGTKSWLDFVKESALLESSSNFYQFSNVAKQNETNGFPL